METLTSQRLELRPWRETDAEALYSIASNPDVALAAGWPPHKDPQDSLYLIQHVLNHPGNFAIVGKDSQALIGSIGLHPTPKISLEEGEVEIGYWIGASYKEKDYEKEAVETLVAHLLEQEDIQAVWVYYDEHDVQTGKMLRSLGFKNIKTKYIEFPLIHLTRKCYFVRIEQEKEDGKEAEGDQTEGKKAFPLIYSILILLVLCILFKPLAPGLIIGFVTVLAYQKIKG